VQPKQHERYRTAHKRAGRLDRHSMVTTGGGWSHGAESGSVKRNKGRRRDLRTTSKVGEREKFLYLVVVEQFGSEFKQLRRVLKFQRTDRFVLSL